MNCIWATFFFVTVFSVGVSMKTEKDLWQQLFENKNYDKRFRPVKNPMTAVPITVGLTPIAFTYKDYEVVSVSTWVSLKWKDEYLQWNPDSFDGIVQIQVPVSKVWTPDLSLFLTKLDTYPLSGLTKTNFVTFDGEFTWVTHNSFPIRCDEEKNPVTCALSFISLTWDNSQIDIGSDSDTEGLNSTGSSSLKKESLSYFKGKWLLESIETSKNLKNFSWNQHSYPVIDFTLKLVN